MLRHHLTELEVLPHIAMELAQVECYHKSRRTSDKSPTLEMKLPKKLRNRLQHNVCRRLEEVMVKIVTIYLCIFVVLVPVINYLCYVQSVSFQIKYTLVSTN